MEIVESSVRKIRISEIEGLDPLTVFLEDIEPGRGSITVKCYNESWSAHWNAMGSGGVESFVLRCGVDYLVNSLRGGLHKYSEDIDEARWFRDFTPLIKAHIIEKRRNLDISPEVARQWYSYVWEDHCLEGLLPQHPFDTFRWPSALDIEEVFYCEEEWADFCSRVEIHYCLNPKYSYLYKIVETIKEALNKVRA